MIRFVFIVVTLFVFASGLYAQEFTFRVDRLDVRDGLIDNKINDILFDRDHSVWIATENGLSHYDGYGFENFSSSNSSFKSDRIVQVHLVPDESLAVLTNSDVQYARANGLYIRPKGSKTFEFHTEFVAPFEDGLIESYWVLFDLDYCYVMDYEGRLHSYHIPSRTWSVNENVDFSNTRPFFKDYLVKVEDETLRFYQLTNPNTTLSEGDMINRFPRLGLIFPYLSKLHTPVQDVLQSSVWDPLNKVVWLHDTKHLLGLFEDGKVVKYDLNEIGLRSGGKNEKLLLTVDRTFFSATSTGIDVFRVETKGFTTYHRKLPLASGINRTSYRGLTVHDSFLYINDREFLFRVKIGEPDQQELLFGELGVLRNFTGIMSYGDEIWTGRQNIYSVEPQSKSVRMIPDSLHSDLPAIWSMAQDKSQVFFGTNRGTYVFEVPQLLRGERKNICANAGLQDLRISYQILPWKEDKYFIVTSNGLFILSAGNCELSKIKFHDTDGSEVSFFHFTHINRETDNTWWLTSLDGGTIQINLKEQDAFIVKSLNKRDGLLTNTAYASYADELGYRWISTDQGLIRLRTEDWVYTVYTEEDGLTGNEFNRVSHTKDDNGNMYFGGLSEVIGINPLSFPAFPNDSVPMRILQFEQFDGWLGELQDRTTSVKNGSVVIFRPSDKFIKLKVGLLDYYRTQEHEFEFQIKGQQAQWQALNGNELMISPLSYGRHRLRIRGRSASGVLSKSELLLTIDMKPPFYLTWWFYLLIGFGIVITIREVWIGKTRRMKIRSEELEQQVKERTATIAQQKEELIKLENVRSRFFANISHELRTPLTLIKGPIDRLLKRKQSEQERSYLEMIAFNSRVLEDRIDDLLALAKADAGMIKPELKAIELNPFLERLMDSFLGQAKNKAIELVLSNHLPASLVIMTDHKKVQQILSNYLSNALKFSGESTKVVMLVDRKDDHLEFAVVDEGPGLSDANQSKVFERFYRVEGASQVEGTGIGLALCRELAHVLNGHVGVESVEGEGSRFILSIPLVAGGQPNIEPLESNLLEPELLIPPQSIDGNKRHHIVIVEDNRALRQFLLSELSAFQVTEFENGAEAWKGVEQMKIAGSLPDLILSDVMMPMMDGFELLKKIQSDDDLSAIPFIMLTARADREDRLRALRIGVHDYLTKPFHTDELLVRIHNLISRNQIKREAQLPSEPEEVNKDEWLERLESNVRDHLSDSNYTISVLAADMFISESQFYRKVKNLTGLTPNKYIREVRLFEARRLLESGEASSVGALSSAVGFEDPDYFSRLYKQRFGHRPSQHL